MYTLSSAAATCQGHMVLPIAMVWVLMHLSILQAQEENAVGMNQRRGAGAVVNESVSTPNGNAGVDLVQIEVLPDIVDTPCDNVAGGLHRASAPCAEITLTSYGSDFHQVQEPTPHDLPVRFWWWPKMTLTVMPAFDGTNDVATFQLMNGDLVSFKKHPANTFWELAGPTDFGHPDNGSPVPYVLTESATSFYLTDPLQERLFMFRKEDAGGARRIERVVDRNGNALIYSYAGAFDDNPTNVTDGLGWNLNLAYGTLGTDTVLMRINNGATWTVDFLHEELGSQDNTNWWTLRGVSNSLGHVTWFEYTTNGFHEMTRVILPEGNAHRAHTYADADLNGTVRPRVVSQQSAEGLTTLFSYSPTSAVMTVQYPDGSTWERDHTSHHSLPVGMTDPLGRTSRFEKNDNEQITRITDRLGNVTAYGYHPPSGKLATATNARGDVVSFAYSPRTQSITNPANGEAVGCVFYDLTQIDWPDGAPDRIFYDGQGNATNYLDRGGNSWDYTYDARGRLLTLQTPLGGARTYTYYSDGTLATATDTDTGVTTYEYDGAKRLRRVVHPDGAAVTVKYDDLSRVRATTNENGGVWQYDYDRNGNLVEVVDPLGNATRSEYDALDRLVSVTNRLSNVTRYEYDGLSRIVTEVLPGGAITNRYDYDSLDRLASVTDGVGAVWEYEYDAEGRTIAYWDPLGRSNLWEYNLLGNVTSRVNRLGDRTQYYYDGMDRLTREIDPLSREMRYEYDARGLLTNVTQGAIGSAGYEYDAMGRLSRITDPDGEAWTFGRTGMGRLQSFQDPLLRITQHQYDLRGRRFLTLYPDTTVGLTRFDPAGNVTNRTLPGGLTLTYEYDALNRLVKAADLELIYDAEGQVTNTRSRGIDVGTAYDALGRPLSVIYGNSNLVVEAIPLENHTVLLAGQRFIVSDYTITVSDDQLTVTIETTHNDAGELTEITRTNSTGASTTLTRDGAGRVSRIQDGSFLDLQYTYDAAGQVASVDVTAPLDPASLLSNRVDAFSFDAAAQVSSTGYAYDLRGRLTNAPGHTYEWDGGSRLTVADAVSWEYVGLLPSDSTPPSVTRVVTVGLTNNYYYNHAIAGAPLVAEQDGNTGQFLRYYVWTPEGRLLCMYDAVSSNVYHYHFDLTGSTMALSDTNGAVTDAYAYSPYGLELGRVGSNPQPFTFIGQHGVRREGAEGLYDMRARYYDAAMGQFLSRDPVWPLPTVPRSINPYQYALRNPISVIDPSGKVVAGLVAPIVFSALVLQMTTSWEDTAESAVLLSLQNSGLDTLRTVRSAVETVRNGSAGFPVKRVDSPNVNSLYVPYLLESRGTSEGGHDGDVYLRDWPVPPEPCDGDLRVVAIPTRTWGMCAPGSREDRPDVDVTPRGASGRPSPPVHSGGGWPAGGGMFGPAPTPIDPLWW